MKNPRLVPGTFFACLLTLICVHAHAQVDRLNESWTVTIGNQTVYANLDGSFLVPSITVVDNNNDMQSDELIRVFAVGRKPDGSRQYAASTHFRLVQGETYFVDALIYSDIPPVGFVQSIRVEGPSELTIVKMAPVSTFITLQTGDEEPAQTADQGTTYRSSNPTIVTVDENGLLEALAPGSVSIIAMNGGAAGVRSVRVMGTQTTTTIQGFVQLPDGASAPGASVQFTDGSSTVADLIGRFEFQVTSSQLLETIQATTSFSDGMDEYVGRSASLPVVPHRITDVGIIVLKPKQPTHLFDHAFIDPFDFVLTNEEVLDVEAEDISGDNITDLIVLGSKEITIWTADNVGKLTETFRDFSGALASITVADYDLDGDQDIVSAAHNHELHWENQGNGKWELGFTPIEGLDLFQEYQFMESKDLDGDGYPELVFVQPTFNGPDPVIAVARNDHGNGYVDPIKFTLTGFTRPLDELELVDINGDQNIDVLAYFGNTTSGLWVGLNDGGGSLTWIGPAPLSGPQSLYPSAHFVDTNDDGHLDVVTSDSDNFPRSELVTFLNLGDGLTFTQAPSIVETNNPLASGDFDRDGIPDILGSKYWNLNRSQFLYDLTLAYGNGFGSFQDQTDLGLDPFYRNGETGDVDGDGFRDAVLWNRRGLGILQNNQAGGMRNEAIMDLNVAASEMVPADMDADGAEEVVILSNSPRSVVVATSNGDRTLALGPVTSIGGSEISDLCVVDLTGNSMLDAVLLQRTSSSADDSIQFLENDGSRNLLKVNAIPIGNISSSAGLAAVNLDQDPAYELILIDRDTVRVFTQIDGFDFQEVASSLVSEDIRGRARHGDFDGDGDIDLLVLRQDHLVVLMQTTPLIFSEGELIGPVTLAPNPAFEPAFVNTDTFVDLIIAEPSYIGKSGGITIYYGSGSGFLLGEEVEAVLTADEDSLCIADLNLDGSLDFVARAGLRGIAAITSTATGNGFSEQVYSGSFVESEDWDIVAIDLDHDGDLDIIQSDTSSRLFLVHENLTQ